MVAGIASVNEAAITGESAPVIRESGGDRSGVTGNTTVVSDQIWVRISNNPGESTLDRMIAWWKGPSGRRPQRDGAGRPAGGLTLIFLLVVATCPGSSTTPGGTQVPRLYLLALFITLIPTTIGGLLSAIGIAGMDRLVKLNVIAKSGRAVEAAGDVRTPAAGQDRHHHLRQPDGGRADPGPRGSRALLAEAAMLARR